MVIDDEKKILQYQNENTYSSMYLWDAIQSNLFLQPILYFIIKCR